VQKAVDYARKAGERAVAQYAWEDAVTQFERALQVADLATPVDEALKCDLLMQAADAIYGTGDQPRYQSAYESAADIARRLNDPDRFARAAMGYARPFSVGLVDEKVVALVNEALEGIPDEDSAMRARLISRLGREQYFGDLEESQRLTNKGVEMARRVGDKRALVETLWNMGWGGTMALEGPEERVTQVEEAIALAEELNDRTAVLTGTFSLIATQMILGDSESAFANIDAYAGIAEEVRIPLWLWQLELLRGMRAMFQGTMSEAEQLVQSALAIGQRADPDTAAQMYGAQIYAIRREQGRLAEMEPAVRGMVQMYPLIPAWRTALGFAYAERGMPDEARVEFEILAKDDFAMFPRDGNWPIAMALLAETCAFLGDRERAQYLYQQLLPVSDRCVLVGAAVDCYGATHRLLGRLATTLERWEDAERHFEDCVEMDNRMGAGRFAGWTFHLYADMLLRRDGPGDREKALSLLSQALNVAERLGMTALLERSLAMKMKAQGIDLSDIGSSIDTVAREALAEPPDLRSRPTPASK
jgi:tetratricopeptide (TPR) repeat protein